MASGKNSLSKSVNPNQIRAGHLSMQPNKLNNFAKLIQNEENFNKAFDTGLQQKQHGSDLIKTLMEESRFFYIGNKKHAFDDEEFIFYIEEATPSRNIEQGHAKCVSCDTQFKNIKQIAYCQFCGYPVCKLCLVKTRPFPCNNDDYKNRGSVCKVCDRKFYVRDMVKASKTKIEAQAILLSSYQKQVQEKEQTIRKMESEQTEFVELNKLEIDKAKEQRKQFKKQKKTLVNENSTINDDLKNLYQKQEATSADLQIYRETIEILKNEMEDLDEQHLRKNLAINQAINEKTRLETELQKFRKLGKQPKGKSGHKKKNSAEKQFDSILSVKEDKTSLNQNSLLNTEISGRQSSETDLMMGSKTLNNNNTSAYRIDTENGSPGGLRFSTGSFSKKDIRRMNNTPQPYCGCGEGKQCSIF